MGSIWRPCHRIKGERSLAMPRHLLFFDTETRMSTKDDGSTEHRLKLGWACYWQRAYGRHAEQEQWYDFKTCESFWEFVFSHAHDKVKLWCIARNINFDFTVLHGWDYLKANGYKLKFFYCSGVTVIISVYKEGSSIILLDSMNWFVESLEKTGLRIGIPKMKVDFDTVSDSDLSVYCNNDVRIELENFRIYIRFLEENKVARLCYTRGSTAMAAYLYSHYKTDIWIHNNAEAIRLEREAYKGGRVECFRLGEFTTGPYTVVDVNSLYPFVMEKYAYPCKYIRQERYPTLVEFRRYLDEYSVCAKVVVDTPLPVYAVRGKRTFFPIGNYTAALCTPELDFAERQGHIVKVMDCVLYERADLFRSYVDHFYAMRLRFKKEGLDEYVEMCKKFLNSLYGKFGQKAEEWTKIGECPDEPDRYETLIYADKPGAHSIRYLMGQCFELTRYDESYDSFPAIAAHVTAYGRLILWGLMSLAGEGNYFYCDTDSLIVNAKGLHNLKREMSDTVLGKLKVVETMNRMAIYGLKDYETGQKIVTKGIRSNAEKLSEGVYRQDKWPSIQGMLRKGKSDVYTVEKTLKHLTRNYEKGIVHPDGTVTPFVLTLDNPL
jgi:hypothetical protein